MKKSDVKRGMKVVPTKRTVGNSLRSSMEWKKAKLNGQPYLYVIGWREIASVWSLAYNKNSDIGDWFRSSDFRPYEESK